MVIFFLYQQGSFNPNKDAEIEAFPGATPEDPNPESSYKKNGFFGTVVSVDPSKKELEVKNSEDGVVYKLRLTNKGVVTRSGKNSEFTEIKIGDKVNIYSEDKETLDENRTISIDLINISVKTELTP